MNSDLSDPTEKEDLRRKNRADSELKDFVEILI